MYRKLILNSLDNKEFNNLTEKFQDKVLVDAIQDHVEYVIPTVTNKVHLIEDIITKFLYDHNDTSNFKLLLTPGTFNDYSSLYDLQTPYITLRPTPVNNIIVRSIVSRFSEDLFYRYDRGLILKLMKLYSSRFPVIDPDYPIKNTVLFFYLTANEKYDIYFNPYMFLHALRFNPDKLRNMLTKNWVFVDTKTLLLPNNYLLDVLMSHQAVVHTYLNTTGSRIKSSSRYSFLYPNDINQVGEFLQIRVNNIHTSLLEYFLDHRIYSYRYTTGYRTYESIQNVIDGKEPFLLFNNKEHADLGNRISTLYIRDQIPKVFGTDFNITNPALFGNGVYIQNDNRLYDITKKYINAVAGDTKHIFYIINSYLKVNKASLTNLLDKITPNIENIFRQEIIKEFFNELTTHFNSLIQISPQNKLALYKLSLIKYILNHRVTLIHYIKGQQKIENFPEFKTQLNHLILKLEDFIIRVTNNNFWFKLLYSITPAFSFTHFTVDEIFDFMKSLDAVDPQTIETKLISVDDITTLLSKALEQVDVKNIIARVLASVRNNNSFNFLFNVNIKDLKIHRLTTKGLFLPNRFLKNTKYTNSIYTTFTFNSNLFSVNTAFLKDNLKDFNPLIVDLQNKVLEKINTVFDEFEELDFTTKNSYFNSLLYKHIFDYISYELKQQKTITKILEKMEFSIPQLIDVEYDELVELINDTLKYEVYKEIADILKQYSLKYKYHRPRYFINMELINLIATGYLLQSPVIHNFEIYNLFTDLEINKLDEQFNDPDTINGKLINRYSEQWKFFQIGNFESAFHINKEIVSNLYKALPISVLKHIPFTLPHLNNLQITLESATLTEINNNTENSAHLNPVKIFRSYADDDLVYDVEKDFDGILQRLYSGLYRMGSDDFTVCVPTKLSIESLDNTSTLPKSDEIKRICIDIINKRYATFTFDKLLKVYNKDVITLLKPYRFIEQGFYYRAAILSLLLNTAHRSAKTNLGIKTFIENIFGQYAYELDILNDLAKFLSVIINIKHINHATKEGVLYSYLSTRLQDLNELIRQQSKETNSAFYQKFLHGIIKYIHESFLNDTTLPDQINNVFYIYNVFKDDNVSEPSIFTILNKELNGYKISDISVQKVFNYTTTQEYVNKIIGYSKKIMIYPDRYIQTFNTLITTKRYKDNWVRAVFDLFGVTNVYDLSKFLKENYDVTRINEYDVSTRFNVNMLFTSLLGAEDKRELTKEILKVMRLSLYDLKDSYIFDIIQKIVPKQIHHLDRDVYYRLQLTPDYNWKYSPTFRYKEKYIPTDIFEFLEIFS